jgi:FSR family fosmidomycin resistance protein-like MFS transporter
MTMLAASRPAALRTLWLLSFGHCCVDLCSAAVTALVPFLVAQRDYSYAAVGVFIVAASIGGALIQPLIGHYGDRTGALWLMPAGLVLAGASFGVVGLLHNRTLVLLAVALCSIGVASYHPEGARWARRAAGSAVATGMSIFSVGGGIGYALGPALVAAIVSPLGLVGTPILIVLPAAAAVAVLALLRRSGARANVEMAAARELGSSLADEWSPFARIVLVNGIQSGIVAGLFAYVPLHLVARGTSAGSADLLSTVMLAAAAAGTLYGGRAADRIGRRVVLIVPMLVLVPLIAVVPSLGFVALVPTVLIIGFAMNTNISLIIVLGQEYLPGRLGLASGVVVGMSVGMGGLVTVLLSLLANAVGKSSGPTAALYVTAALPVLAAALSASLPSPAAASPESIWSRAARGVAER